MVQEEFAGSEEDEVDHGAAEDPGGEVTAEIAGGRHVADAGGNGLPSTDVGADEAVEGIEGFAGFGGGEQGDGEPDYGGDYRGGQGGFGEDDGRGSMEGMEPVERDGDGERAGHGRDFRPCVDAPPVPAQEIDGSGSGADFHDDLPAAGDGVQIDGDPGGGDDQQDGGESRDHYIVSVAGRGAKEAAIEVGDEVGGSPVELGGDGGHEGGEESGNGEAAHGVGQEVVHYQHVAGFGMGESGAKNDDAEGGHDPRPGADGVVSDVEPEHTEQTLALVAGGENALGNVASAAGFGSGIPEGPPLQTDVDEEGGDGDGPEHFSGETGGKTGEKRERVAGGGRAHGRQSSNQRRHAANGADGVEGDGDDDRHLEDELEEVSPEDSPEAAEGDIESGEGDEEEDAEGKRGAIGRGPDAAEGRDPMADVLEKRRAAKGGGDDAGHGLGDPSEDDAVHEKAEIDGAESAKEGRGLAA